VEKQVLQNNVEDLRKKKKVTQEELGNAVGVTRQTIIAIEKGNYIPSLLLALNIAKYFKLSIEEIFVLKHI
jgi:putative transcriptional regulator